MEYTYIAYNKENRIINGSVAATDERAAGDRLSNLGYKVLSLKTVRPFEIGLEKIFSSPNSKVNTGTIITFSRQMATLMNAGVNIITSLDLLEAQTPNKKFKVVLNTIISDVRKGEGLSEAMSRHPQVFPSLYCRSLKVGEQSGDLSRVLNQIADYLEKGVKARKSLKSALTYPAIIVVVAIVVITVLVTFVFPTFIGLYQTMDVKLPAVTLAMLAILKFIKIVGPYVLGLIAVGIIGLVIYVRKPAGRYQWDKLLLKLPVLGHIILLRELAVSCQTMSILFHTGLPLSEIMDVLIDSSGNSVVTQALTDVKQSVFKGEGLSQPMAQNPVFLPMMVEMVKVGEETGEMDSTLIAVAQNYNADADSRTSAFISIIQPAITIVIGVFVFFIVLSMMSLMYSIYGQVKV